MNVLVIPEDFRKDQFVLKPLIEKMFAEIGKPRAKVEMCLDPLLGGIDQATNWETIADILDMYPMVDIFLLLVDRDGKAGRRRALNGLEAKAREILEEDRLLLAENAWQEIEVWALAGQDLPKKWKWQEIREEVHPKEEYFIPLAKKTFLARRTRPGPNHDGKRSSGELPTSPVSVQEDVENLQIRLCRMGEVDPVGHRESARPTRLSPFVAQTIQ